MSVQVEAIKFNHDQNSAIDDALNIRRNATAQVLSPEWQRGVTINPEDSAAAYSINTTQGETLTIQVQLRRTTPDIDTIKVRAVDPVLWWYRGPQGCLYWLLTKLGAKVDPGPPTDPLNVLGEVKAKEVTFNADGLTDFVTFELENPLIWSRGVGVYDIKWLWQSSQIAEESWTDIEWLNWSDMKYTQHRIYAVLDIPKLPWVQSPFDDSQVPWVDALDYACKWAYGSKTLDEAAERITKSIYALGPDFVEYDCPHGGAPFYSSGAFDCSEFIELLKGGNGLGRYVNCSDCATFVSTFANILGCDLWQSRMYGWFGLNPLLAIGSDVWQSACGWPGFSYHEVAWKGACSNNDKIYDACLAVDGDSDPTDAPHLFLLPVNIPFLDYRQKLVVPDEITDCNADESYKTRRVVI